VPDVREISILIFNHETLRMAEQGIRSAGPHMVNETNPCSSQNRAPFFQLVTLSYAV